MRVDRLAGLDLRLGEGGWPFAEEHAAAIARYWRELVARKPGLWNGEVLICTAAEVAAGVLTARFAFTDYASFVAWRDWGTPDRTVRNCFGVPVVASADGALLFAEMAGHTLNAGLVYPPSGSLERRDLGADGGIDIEGSMRLELAEETGLDCGAAQAGPLLAFHDAHRLAVARGFRFAEDFATLARRFAAHRPHPHDDELARLIAVRAGDAVLPQMPAYAREIARRHHLWFMED